jgi:type IV pilus assembly protein PilQ
VWVRDVDFETLLDVMLSGTEFSYHIDEGIWIFGGVAQEGSPVTVEVVGMKYRSANKLSEIIPQELSSGIQIQEFHDLNSVILSGNGRRVSQAKAFLRSIDRQVPLVTIEVMIVDATKRRIMEIGVDAGFGKKDVVSGGSLSGVDVMLNASSVNRLINGFNGFGSVNLGMVNEGFYLGLQFLEDRGEIELQSTPKLSTLNGHEATLTSGETRYYKETANNYYGSQITMATESYVWKPIDANLEIKITPFVSEDRQITLDIAIDQKEFTTREEPEAPPGTATRSFKSLIRVQNQEMVLLGGIDQNTREKSGRGLPWIARVPVIKWFFGKSKDNKNERRLNVFIKPTLVE